MQVLMKSDGLPTYHLANVVDDHLMEITHVIRGEEWVSSAPKHLLLYKYFGWEPPALMHLPLLRNPDKSKLSKRKNPTSILFYERMGYLPEALLNFLGHVDASRRPKARRSPICSALIERFSFENVSLGGPVFDVAKLDWLNGKYLRELDDETFMNRAVTWGFDRQRLERDRGARAFAHRATKRLGPADGVFLRRPLAGEERRLRRRQNRFGNGSQVAGPCYVGPRRRARIRQGSDRARP